MKKLLIIFLLLISCKEEEIHHSYLQDFEVVDKIYHYENGFEYHIRDSFGKTFIYHSTQHFAVGDKIELTLKL